MDISRNTILNVEHQLENTIRKDLIQTIRIYGLSHAETIAIGQKMDKYIFELQLIKQFKGKWFVTKSL
ncbi:Spo0E family sporulation regulatory protein-aspartic acid phosphatase [Metabacillus sp. KUDC1714]|uniref:Aspartyl-phosphate phosphatase Spo0E family protein n=2 Tax=Metabacillus TaxID=2675233 RepID=A0A179T3B6_9BACI|nr:hypothetical protein A6K24_17520 [Metabacillus litoralis]QNF27395.1 aspartyl-phosphate phosphatase Spo0E family protein [Metabacillus sp. KUDC1714]